MINVQKWYIRKIDALWADKRYRQGEGEHRYECGIFGWLHQSFHFDRIGGYGPGNEVLPEKQNHRPVPGFCLRGRRRGGRQLSDQHSE